MDKNKSYQIDIDCQEKRKKILSVTTGDFSHTSFIKEEIG